MTKVIQIITYKLFLRGQSLLEVLAGVTYLGEYREGFRVKGVNLSALGTDNQDTDGIVVCSALLHGVQTCDHRLAKQT